MFFIFMLPKKRFVPYLSKNRGEYRRIGENFADILYRNFYVVSAFIDIITVPKKTHSLEQKSSTRKLFRILR